MLLRFGHPNLAYQAGMTSKELKMLLYEQTICHVMSNQDHLHREINIIPIKEHNAMLTKQYILTCHLPGHPSNPLVNQGLPERNLRKYAAREYKESFIPRGGLNQANLT